jgi:hypothetical protein
MQLDPIGDLHDGTPCADGAQLDRCPRRGGLRGRARCSARREAQRVDANDNGFAPERSHTVDGPRQARRRLTSDGCPGAIFLDLDLGWSDLPHRIAGDVSTGNITLRHHGRIRRQNVDPIRRAAEQPPWCTLGELLRIRRHRAEAETSAACSLWPFARLGGRRARFRQPPGTSPDAQSTRTITRARRDRERASPFQARRSVSTSESRSSIDIVAVLVTLTSKGGRGGRGGVHAPRSARSADVNHRTPAGKR